VSAKTVGPETPEFAGLMTANGRPSPGALFISDHSTGFSLIATLNTARARATVRQMASVS
jgi:hypothetical protein